MMKEYRDSEEACIKESHERMKQEKGYDPTGVTQYYWDWSEDELGWFIIKDINNTTNEK